MIRRIECLRCFKLPRFTEPDVVQGWTYRTPPYAKVLEADFSAFTTPGEYRLWVPGLGVSFPFRRTATATASMPRPSCPIGLITIASAAVSADRRNPCGSSSPSCPNHQTKNSRIIIRNEAAPNPPKDPSQCYRRTHELGRWTSCFNAITAAKARKGGKTIAETGQQHT